MTDQDSQKSFIDLLEEIFSAEQIPIQHLYRLSDLEPHEFNAFRQRWDEADTDRRGTLLRHMTDLTEENFVVDFTPMFAIGFNDQAPVVRVAALDGMWDATDLAYIAPITTLMQSDPHTSVRAAAARALSHYVLMAEWGQLPKKILPPLVDNLLAAYEKEETPMPVKRAILEALGSANHPRVAGLIRAAYDMNSLPMQLSAVFAMGRSADRQWVSTLLAEMDSIHAEMRAEAARAIGDIGSSDALTKLGQLVYDEERDVQLAAIAALGAIGGEMANEILVALAADMEEDELLLDALEDALEEMAMLAGEFDYFDWLEEDESNDNDFHLN